LNFNFNISEVKKLKKLNILWKKII